MNRPALAVLAALAAVLVAPAPLRPAAAGGTPQPPPPVEVRTAEEARALDPATASVRIAEGHADEVAAEVAKLKKLQVVDAKASGLSDEGLRALGGVKSLVELDASECPEVGDAGILALGSLKRVEVLRLRGDAKVGDAALVPIGKFARLRVLDLAGCKAIRDAGLEALRDLPKIEDLDLSGVRISEKGTPHLARLRSLKRIALNGTGIPDMSMQDVVALIDLEVLEVADNSAYEFGRIGLLHVDGLRKLRTLDVSKNEMVTDDVMRSVAAIPGLEVLRAADCRNAGDAGATALASAKALRDADLSGTGIGPKGLSALGASKTLAKVRVARCPRLPAAEVEKARGTMGKVEVITE